jgi:diaminopimelate epimerase
MTLRFYKFQANGNDFVIIDDRDGRFPQNKERIAGLCHRHFGIGADGLMLLKTSGDYDFEMLYFNADGQPAEMCGNGGRCIAALAYSKGIAGKTMRFLASDGLHEARVEDADKERSSFDVSLKMQPVPAVQRMEDGYFLNTGVPHFVCFVSSVEEVDVEKEGSALRKDNRFAPAGTNVNFVEIQSNRLFVRTYERGVEGETLSCGTGVTASAIATSFKTQQNRFAVHTHGGDFQVRFDKMGNRFENVWLRGPARQVFVGEATF